MQVPVVVTNVGGVGEQVIDGKSGVVVEPERPDLLAEAVSKLLNSPEEDLEKMRKEGRKRTEELFSLRVIAGKHKEIYEGILLNIDPGQASDISRDNW